jgi:hypothetical protein
MLNKLSDVTLLILFLLIIISPGVFVTFFVLSSDKYYSLAKRRKLRIYAIISPFLTFVVYLLYEWVMPIEMNIRVDMIIILPLLGINFLSLVFIAIHTIFYGIPGNSGRALSNSKKE